MAMPNCLKDLISRDVENGGQYERDESRSQQNGIRSWGVAAVGSPQHRRLSGTVGNLSIRLSRRRHDEAVLERLREVLKARLVALR